MQMGYEWANRTRIFGKVRGMSKRILVVDDELNILKALQRLFRRNHYEVITARSGAEALEALEREEVNLMITDIRMPQMNGMQLLEKVKEEHPLVARIALTGYTESSDVYRAIDENLARIFLFKPWNNDELIELMDNFFRLEDSLKNSRLLNLINNTDSLPTLPTLYTTLNQMIREDKSVKDITEKIEQDPSIASKVLRVANSAFYGAKTGSISKSIMYLGLVNVKNIVLTNSVFAMTDSIKEMQDFLWAHAVGTNKLLSMIYRNFLKKKLPNSYASAGLLHNIGVVVLYNEFGKDYLKVVSNALWGGKGLDVSEEENGYLSHMEIGGYLLDWWEMPLGIVEAALYHHNPLDERIINKELVTAVHIASNYMLSYIQKKKTEHLMESAFSVLGIDQKIFEDFFAEKKNEFLIP